MSLLNPLALALGALALPIIMLYMLRLRRTETPISSTFLWRQLVRNQEANAPWQRLRFSWLLLLQLLILAALVLALARPFVKVKTITTGRIVLLLDASASMQATDVTPNRFAVAREIGLELVDMLGADDTMSVIRVSAMPEVLAAASRDKVVLREAIQSATPSAVSADWFAAMTVAAAGAVGVDELKVVIITDGGLPSDLPVVPGDVRFVAVGEQADNLAISALALAALPGQTPQLFARISNHGTVDTDVIMDLKLDDENVIFMARRYTVPAGDHVDIFDIELPEQFDTLTAQITLPRQATMPDYLAVDNVAYVVRDQAGAGRVLLVTEGNLFLEQVFRSLQGVTLFQSDPSDDLPRDEFDLYVFDSMLPKQLPEGALLIVNPPGNTTFFQVGDRIEPIGPLLAHSTDTRTRNLGGFMNSVNMQEYRVLRDVAWGTVLVQVQMSGHPLVVAGEVENHQVAVLPFDARYPNTDWVLQPAWPILIAELAAWFSAPRITDAAGGLSPGAPVTMRFIENADEAVVSRPNGRRAVLPPRDSSAVFAGTDAPGFYRVDLRKDGMVLKSEQFAVNLFDPAESQIAPQSQVVIGTETIGQAAREETGRREFWPWVAGIGLVILMVEWWMYHRTLRRTPRVMMSGLYGASAPPLGRLRTAFRRAIKRD